MRDPVTPPTMATTARTRAEPPFRQGAPNVMVIVCDDLGFAHLGSYGSDLLTPNLDRLAGRGLRFTNFHTTAVCSPTRGVPADGPQPSPGRDGHAARPADELPGVLGPHAPVGGNARADPARRGLRDLLRRQVASRAARPARHRPVRHVADRARLRPLLRVPQRRDEPVDAEPRARHEPRGTAAHTRRRVPPRRRPRRQRDRVPARAPHLAPGPAVPALVRVGRAARAPPGAARMDRPLPRPLRRRLGRVARRDAGAPDRARDPPGRHASCRSGRRGSRNGRRSTRPAVACTRG